MLNLISVLILSHTDSQKVIWPHSQQKINDSISASEGVNQSLLSFNLAEDSVMRAKVCVKSRKSVCQKEQRDRM